MRCFLPYIISAAICFGSTAAAAADDRIILNGTPVNCIVSGSNIGYIQISARTLFEAAGFTVQWFPDECRVTAFSSDLKITMFADNRRIYINNIGYITDGDISISDGIFTIPLSAAASALDAEVSVSGNTVYLTSDIAVDCSGWQYDVLELINEQRSLYGLRPFVWNSDLAAAAYEHCADMAERDYFSHDTPEGLTPFERMRNMGIRYAAAAENIAAGQPDPQSVVEAWMNSPSHRENILDPKLNETGISFVRGGTYGIYWVQEFASTK